MLVSDGELNVLEDILTEAPDQDDELYNPESEREISDKKGTVQKCFSVNLICECEEFFFFFLPLIDIIASK